MVDLGFGQNLAGQQARGEPLPAGQLETLSFDAAGGFAGTNAYGNRTNHGGLIAQTVFDYAPKARYLLVNYHTEADFLAAVDTIVARRPDIVVHSNSFIEGPFDGTSPPARAVDRVLPRHPLVQLRWQLRPAPLERRLDTDADADADLDWLNGDSWTFQRSAGLPITFALSWPAARRPGHRPRPGPGAARRERGMARPWAPATGSPPERRPPSASSATSRRLRASSASECS